MTRYIRGWLWFFYLVIGIVSEQQACFASEEESSPIIVSLTSTADRVERSLIALHSLLDQTKRPDRIIFNLAFDSYFDNDKGMARDQIPEEVLHLERLGLIDIRMTNNLGPFTKLAPTLEEYYDQKEAIIITVDDDIVYPSVFIEGLVNASKKYPSHVIAYSARELQFTSNLQFKPYEQMPFVKPPKFLNPKETPYIVRGVYGVLYKPKFFRRTVLAYDEYKKKAPFADDLWISGHLVRNCISAVVIPTPDEGFPNAYVWYEKSLFSKYNEKGGNDQALENLKDFFLTFKRGQIKGNFLTRSLSRLWHYREMHAQ